MSDPEDPGGSPSTVAVEDEQDVAVDTAALGRAAGRALEALRVPPLAELSVNLVDLARIVELKEQAFGVRAPTDVLAFPIDDPDHPSPGPLVLGDVVICPAVAERQARALGRAFEDEMLHLLVHGILHLLGRDHDDVTSERAMAGEQRDLLALLEASS